MKNLSLRMQIFVSIIIPLVLMIVVGLLAIQGINNTNATNERVEHTYIVLGQAESIVGSAVDIETGMRGYLLAGKEEFLDPYKSGEKATYAKIDALKNTVSDNPKQADRLTEMEKVLREWQEKDTTPSISLRREIGNAETMNDIAKLVGEGRGKVFFDKFRGQIQTFIDRESTLLDKRQKEMNLSGSQNNEEVKKSINWVIHTYKVIGQANSILMSAVDMETGARGYLLAGKEEFLAPYNNGGKKFFELTSSLKNLVNDNPAQVQLLGEMESTIGAWQKEVIEPEIVLRRKIGSAKTMDDMARRVGEGHGKQYFDKFRQLMADFNDEETKLMDKRKEANKAAISNMFMLIYSAILVAIVLSLGVGLYMVRRIFSQVGGEPATIAVLTQQIAQGDLTVRFTDTGKETGIYAAMRDMATQLKDMVSQVTQSTGQVSSAAAEIAQGSSDLAQRTEEQASA
ncbi:MAG: CHASE3 domain-containing protein, partial [Candidatus Contendobacter sp.]|nr:CHASE3 domain-containing protein [Candidatus Contendobacter sp.]